MKTVALLLVLLWPLSASAASRYAKAAGGNWSTAATWSATGCAGVDSVAAPTSSDDVTIEGCAGIVTLDTSGLTAKSVTIAATGRLTAANGGVDISLSLQGGATGTIWSADPAAVLDLGVTLLIYASGTSGSTATFAGGGLTYGDFTMSWVDPTTVLMTGANTFNTILFTVPGLLTGTGTLALPAGVTTTVGNIRTSPTLLLTGHYALASSTPGMPATISKANGVVNLNYLAVIDSTATGGATWCVYTQMIADGGGNTGWSFTACPYEPLQSLTGVGR